MHLVCVLMEDDISLIRTTHSNVEIFYLAEKCVGIELSPSYVTGNINFYFLFSALSSETQL